jgi:hypothetical protein
MLVVLFEKEINYGSNGIQCLFMHALSKLKRHLIDVNLGYEYTNEVFGLMFDFLNASLKELCLR